MNEIQENNTKVYANAMKECVPGRPQIVFEN